MHTDYKKVEINSDELVELKAIEHDLKSRFVVFQFLSNNVPINLSSCTVRAYALNSKKNEIFNNLKIIDASRGKAELELTDAFLKRGTTIYQLKIYGAKGEKLSSNIFSLNVGEDLMRDNSIESTNEFNALEEALNEVKGFEEVKREILDLKNLLAETIT
ncbi:BppU family phage baseplate upper protein, partial [Clostridium perfringens]|nr:BppU family phage baseplate upper protein [Clostridium perfringens]